MVNWHCNPEKYKEGPINKMQERNKRIDEMKDRWALSKGIPILRIWEDDIKNNPLKVMKILKENIRDSKESLLLKEKRKIRPKIKKP